MSSNATILRGTGVTKRYGAVEALTDVEFEVRKGEIVGLAGDNGAGKSTLMKIISGSTGPTAGALYFKSERIVEHSPAHVRNLGIEMVYQDLALCENLDIRENIFLGREPRRRFRLVDYIEMTRRAGSLLDRLEIAVPSLLDPVSTLSGGQRQAVAICRALAFSPALVLLDEPTAALSVNAVQPLLSLIRLLPREGASVVLVSHRLSDLINVTDRICVLRNGRVVANLETRSTSEHELLTSMAGLPVKPVRGAD